MAHDSLCKAMCLRCTDSLCPRPAVMRRAGEDTVDLLATSERLVSWQHLIYGCTGWAISLTWLALHTFDKRLGRWRPSPHHPISGPISGFTSAWMASYSLTMFKSS